MAYKDFQAADVLTAQEVDTYLMRQAVMVFASAAARNAALTNPVEGMMTYLQDTNRFQIFDGSAWAGFSTTGSLLSDASISAGTSIAAGTSISAGTTMSAATSVRANTGGADGGSVLRQWTGGAGYTGLATNGMAGNEYMMISDGTETYVSGGVGGTVYMRAGNNDSSGQVAVSNDTVQLINKVVMPNQPYAQMRGAGGNWFQPSGPMIQNGPSGFSWSVYHNIGGHFNATTGSFIAPKTGVYLCSFQTYQQTYSGTSWIHWMWLIGGTITWHNGSQAYNIFGYSDSAYADGAGMCMMLYVTAGNAIQVGGYMGNDERFYSDYTYMAIRLLG